jgi:hypothetical protein
MGVSDLTGQMAEEDQLGTLTVLEHPELAEGPVLVEALAEEVKTLPRLSVPAVIVEWRAPRSLLKLADPDWLVVQAVVR